MTTQPFEPLSESCIEQSAILAVRPVHSHDEMESIGLALALGAGLEVDATEASALADEFLDLALQYWHELEGLQEGEFAELPQGPLYDRVIEHFDELLLKHPQHPVLQRLAKLRARARQLQIEHYELIRRCASEMMDSAGELAEQVNRHPKTAAGRTLQDLDDDDDDVL